MTDRSEGLIQQRTDRLQQRLGRTLDLPPKANLPPLTDREMEYLVGEAESLYWNELEWEHITEEERLDEGQFTELAFPGFLAYMKGLLLREVMPDALAPAAPRPEVVQRVLEFLEGRVSTLRAELDDGAEDAERSQTEHSMTSRLIDLVLIRLYGLNAQDLESLETDPAGS